MLKLFWRPAPSAGTPSKPSWQASADSLFSDSPSGAPLQRFVRQNTGLPDPTPELVARLDKWLAARSSSAPVTIMVHGFDYDPATFTGAGNDDPFSLIYGVPGTSPGRLSLLPLVGECDEMGGKRADVAIAFAWVSAGNLQQYGDACWDNDYKLACLDLAPLAAQALATVIKALSARRVPVHLLAHSLGTRAVGQAIGILHEAGATTSVARVVLLGGAEFGADAAASYKGCTFDVINLANSQDFVLRTGGQIGCHPVRPNGSQSAAVIGRHGLGNNPSWLDMQLDNPKLVAWLAAGHAPTGKAYAVTSVAEDNVHPNGTYNHWAYYTNRGNRALVTDLVQSSSMTVAALTAAGAPNGTNQPMYKHFDGVTIPRVPTTCEERKGMMLIATNDPTTMSG